MSDIIGDMMKEDALIREKQSKIMPGDSPKFLDCLMERHRLYSKYENIAKATGDVQRAFMISGMREDVLSQVMIYKIKVDLEGDIAKIFSRLDDLETKIRDSNPQQ
jgi:hypothetical protein